MPVDGTSLPQVSENVKPLIHRTVDDDDAEAEVGTSDLFAEHRATLNGGSVAHFSECSTPPTIEIIGPPKQRDDPDDNPGGGRNQQLKGDRKQTGNHGEDTDSEYEIDKRGQKHRKDEYGQRFRKSGRSPYIPTP